MPEFMAPVFSRFFSQFASLTMSSGFLGRWKLWALIAVTLMVAALGTWITGQYQIGRLDSLKNRYDQPITNYAKNYSETPENSLERDLLEGCKQAQIGTWLQTTDALRFDSPLTGNRVTVRLDVSKAFVDLNGREISECVQDEVEDRQFDIGSLTSTWAVILMLISVCMGGWAWICYQSFVQANKSRNIYAETLAEGVIEPTVNDVVETSSDNLEKSADTTDKNKTSE
jgi:hypothetical protein